MGQGRTVRTEEDFEAIRKRIRTCPSCTTPEKYEAWVNVAANIKPPYSTWFCTDCTPTFAARSRMRGVCDYPEIKFRRDKDGGLEGYFPRQRTKAET